MVPGRRADRAGTRRRGHRGGGRVQPQGPGHAQRPADGEPGGAERLHRPGAPGTGHPAIGDSDVPAGGRHLAGQPDRARLLDGAGPDGRAGRRGLRDRHRARERRAARGPALRAVGPGRAVAGPDAPGPDRAARGERLPHRGGHQRGRRPRGQAHLAELRGVPRRAGARRADRRRAGDPACGGASCCSPRGGSRSSRCTSSTPSSRRCGCPGSSSAPGTRDTPRVALAALEAEAFLVWPKLEVRRLARRLGLGRVRRRLAGTPRPGAAPAPRPGAAPAARPGAAPSGSAPGAEPVPAAVPASRPAAAPGGPATGPGGPGATAEPAPARSDGQPASGHVAATPPNGSAVEPGPAKSSPAESSSAEVSPVEACPVDSCPVEPSLVEPSPAEVSAGKPHTAS